MERRHFLKAAAMGTSAAKNVRIAAVCDVWDESLQKARQIDFYTNPSGELLHLQGWIDAVRARRQPNASAAHLANQSLREGRVAHYG
jgi:hypothetical protein